MKSIIVTYEDFLRYQNGLDNNKISKFINKIIEGITKHSKNLSRDELSFKLEKDNNYEKNTLSQKYYLKIASKDELLNKCLGELNQIVIYVKA